MSTFLVREQILYKVEAMTEKQAIQHVISDRDRDKHCIVAVEERWATKMEAPRDSRS